MNQNLINIFILATLILIILIFLVMMFFVLPRVGHKISSKFKKNIIQNLGISTKMRIIHELNNAILYLSKNKIGAIITITRHDSLDKLRTDGIHIDADISSSLIIAIFAKNSPLHDGSIIIESKKIKYAGTFFKITSKSINNKHGSRHRAAIGITEISDALSIIVSEETGNINFSMKGKLSTIKSNEFQNKINDYLELRL